MYGRRRRPLLGAAVLVGASRAAARHEVQKQAVLDSHREMEIQREIEMRRRQDAEQELRTQRAVDEAMKKAAMENQASQQSAAGTVPQPPQQFYNNQPPPYTPTTSAAGPSSQPEKLMRAPSPQVPCHLSVPPPQDGRPKSAQGIRSEGPALGSNTRFCTQCGFACQVRDKFCSRCGAKQVDQERWVE